jgi:succinoglycan biosynthesis transport protein ExoP
LNAAVAMPFSGFSRGVKALKTAIALASRTHNIRTIAVTSALPNEGKSTLTANLAALYAANGVRVLLIDGDLHTGRLSQHLAGEPGTGIVDALEDPARLDDCIVRLDDSGVDLLPATNGSGARCDDLLASPAAGELMAVLQKTYELVIVELPPLVASADSLAVSAIVDGTIVVAEWGKTPMPVLGEAVHLLRNAQARILGVALNKVDTSAVSYGEVSYGNLAYWSPPGTKRRA